MACDEKKTYVNTFKTNDEAIQNMIKQIKYYANTFMIPYNKISIISNTYESVLAIMKEFERKKLPHSTLIKQNHILLVTQNKVYKMKGFQWSVVFLFGMCDESFLFKSDKNKDSKADKSTDNENIQKNILYVAMT
jgi:superfamily I DNA/RNA helicase